MRCIKSFSDFLYFAIFGPDLKLSCLRLLAILAFGSSALSGMPLAELDAKLAGDLLEHASPGKPIVYVDDMGFKVSYLKSCLMDGKEEGGGPGFLAFEGRSRWPSGIVYYSFAGDVDSSQRQQFLEACDEWRKCANVTFLRRTNQNNYIHVVLSKTTNRSVVGMQGGSQEMEIISWDKKFVICHEIGHALGACHEHCRSDRDEYVSIIRKNIESGHEFNFEKLKSKNLTPYDFESVMHYAKSDFGENKANTILPRPAYKEFANIMGQRSHLSELDKEGMAAVYGPRVPLKFVKMPASSRISAGKTATLKFVAKGSGPIKCQWFEGEKGNVSKRVGTSEIFVTPRLSSTKHYWVRLTNRIEVVDSKVVTVTMRRRVARQLR